MLKYLRMALSLSFPPCAWVLPSVEVLWSGVASTIGNKSQNAINLPVYSHLFWLKRSTSTFTLNSKNRILLILNKYFKPSSLSSKSQWTIFTCYVPRNIVCLYLLFFDIRPWNLFAYILSASTRSYYYYKYRTYLTEWISCGVWCFIRDFWSRNSWVGTDRNLSIVQNQMQTLARSETAWIPYCKSQIGNAKFNYFHQTNQVWPEILNFW